MIHTGPGVLEARLCALPLSVVDQQASAMTGIPPAAILLVAAPLQTVPLARCAQLAHAASGTLVSVPMVVVVPAARLLWGKSQVLPLDVAFIIGN